MVHWIGKAATSVRRSLACVWATRPKPTVPTQQAKTTVSPHEPLPDTHNHAIQQSQELYFMDTTCRIISLLAKTLTSIYKKSFDPDFETPSCPEWSCSYVLAGMFSLLDRPDI